MRRYLREFVYRFRGRRRPEDRPAILLGLDAPMSMGSAADNDAKADVARRLDAMPASVRETYLLRMVDGMSIDQIADHLAISRRQVRRNLRRAIAMLLR